MNLKPEHIKTKDQADIFRTHFDMFLRCVERDSPTEIDLLERLEALYALKAHSERIIASKP
jgi:hypothetical protein